MTKLTTKMLLEVLEKKGINRATVEKMLKEERRVSPKLTKEVVTRIEEMLSKHQRVALYISEAGNIFLVHPDQYEKGWKFRGKGGPTGDSFGNKFKPGFSVKRPHANVEQNGNHQEVVTNA